jgi:hypothetical protein
VRRKHIHVVEGRIAQARHRTAVMQDLPHFIAAFAHRLKLLSCDRSQFTFMHTHPRIDGGIAFDSAVQSQQFRSHRRSIFAFGSHVTSHPCTANESDRPSQRSSILSSVLRRVPDS